ncbi:hypothetical protein TSOC_010381 [Tetrabaena socialis]|uniref:Serine/threonine-protein kinase haspin C-terminal domain-containing protein n=1 Tax=Tetrabaena socialis TaxID=47790 RepID=A0A2J7ZTG6_9CHLO|nr:hypothetical protein TSOC_010381 [Tetrabaena socialis]|eukprot:PNH03564.1 hypothetical protein TSOC_010381 [Tetrabaena socialis]
MLRDATNVAGGLKTFQRRGKQQAAEADGPSPAPSSIPHDHGFSCASVDSCRAAGSDCSSSGRGPAARRSGSPPDHDAPGLRSDPPFRRSGRPGPSWLIHGLNSRRASVLVRNPFASLLLEAGGLGGGVGAARRGPGGPAAAAARRQAERRRDAVLRVVGELCAQYAEATVSGASSSATALLGSSSRMRYTSAMSEVHTSLLESTSAKACAAGGGVRSTLRVPFRSQFDTYRWMRRLVGDDWSASVPATNCLWLAYMAEVLGAKYGGGVGTAKYGGGGKGHGEGKARAPLSAAQRRQLREFRKRAVAYDNCRELLRDELFEGLVQEAEEK